MNRREFIEKTGAVAAMSLLPLAIFSIDHAAKYKLGYQLYSVRDQMAKDPLATLKALKAMGYQDFETYGYEDTKDMFYGYRSLEFKQVLDQLDLSVSSGHYGFSPYLERSDEALKRFVDQCIKGAKALDSHYITWPFISPEQRNLDTYKLMAKKLNLIGQQVKKAGLGFAYHNHGYEFEDHNGENGFDIIIEQTDPALVKLQMDMYWVMHSSSYTPKQLIERQPGRFVMWHIKDMDKVSKDYTELGNGSINYLELLPDPTKSGLEYFFIEQGGNYSENSLKSAEISATYFKKYLQKAL